MRFILMDRYGGNLGDLPSVETATRTRAADGTDTLDLTTIGDVQKDERVIIQDSRRQWAEYICQSAQTDRSTGLPITTAYCTSAIAELSRTYIVDKRNRAATAADCLAKALEGTRWTMGQVQSGTATTIADLSFYHCTVLEAVQRISDTYGLEVQTGYALNHDATGIQARTISLLEQRGDPTSGRRFEYGRDLVEVKRTIDAADIVTRLYGWGKGIEQTDEQGQATGGYSRKISFADINNGRPYVQDDTALANWGIPGPDGRPMHAEGSVDFPDCEDPYELLRLTQAELERRSTPTVSYEATVASLGRAGMSVDGVEVGDSVQIVDTTFPQDLRLSGRVLKIEEELLGPVSDIRLTLGNISQSYTQRLAAQQQAVDRLIANSGAWDGAASGSHVYINDVINRVNRIMNETGGYTYMVPGEGIYVYDRPKDQNPTQVIQIGGGHWRIADRRKADGEWDYRSLADGHGIYADSIFTGTIAGGSNFWNLDTGQLMFRQGYIAGGGNSWNLNTGDFTLAKGTITINGPYGTQIRINPNEGFRITQYGLLIGGMEIVDGVAHVRAQRVGTSPSLYLTTGRTDQGNPGASFYNSQGDYLDMEATHDVTSPAGMTTGMGMSTFNKPVMWADTYQYPYTKVQAPVREGSYLDADAQTALTIIQDKHATLSGKESVRLLAPRLVVGTNPDGAGIYGWTGTVPIVTSIRDAGNGTVAWTTSGIKVVNGIITWAPGA